MTQVVFRSLKLSYSGKKANATGCFYSEAKPADAHVNPRELSWPPFAGQDHDYVYWERMKLTLTILRGKYTVPYTKGKAFEFNVQFLTSRLRDSFGPVVSQGFLIVQGEIHIQWSYKKLTPFHYSTDLCL